MEIRGLSGIPWDYVVISTIRRLYPEFGIDYYTIYLIRDEHLELLDFILYYTGLTEDRLFVRVAGPCMLIEGRYPLRQDDDAGFVEFIDHGFGPIHADRLHHAKLGSQVYAIGCGN